MNKEKAFAIANLTLGATMDIETVCSAYFKNDGEAILKGVAMNVKNPESLLSVIEQANYEIENEEVLATQSNFGKIQKEIVEQVINEDNLSFIQANIISNPGTIGEKKDCPEITSSQAIVNDMGQRNIGLPKVV